MTSIVNTVVTTLLTLRGLPALALVFALPAGESAVFLGFVFPGETAAVLAGVLAFYGRLSLPAAFTAVILGCVVGDSVGYWVGHRWGTRLLEGPLSRWIKPSHVERARSVVQRRGGWAVFVGRFTITLRTLVPGLAGMAEMPYRRFLVANVAGGVIWGATYVVLGYLAGASWRSAVHVAGTAGLVGFSALVVILVMALLIRRRRRAHRAPASAPAA